MRIISGKFKGKKIEYTKTSLIRPLKDFVKENIFNILSHSNLINQKINNSTVLDLYSGVGSFGLECISRGAKKVTFVEEDNKAISILKKNLQNLSINKYAELINDKIENIIKWHHKNRYDIFFFDPPFKKKNFEEVLEIFRKKKLYTSQHIIILHREINSIDNLEQNIKIILTKEYRRSKIIFAKFS